jgi:hypothetical protein
MRAGTAFVLLVACAVPLRAQDRPVRQFDEILDQYVRDGMVYYRALRQDHTKLEAYVAWLATESVEKAPREQQVAFWLNAYDALVLKTVVDHYPISRVTPIYPPHSIRQIPGAFEQLPHRVAGRSVTLDQIEQTILPAFKDPRVYLAIGRGAIGGGRLRSEAFAADRIEAQLTEVAAECAGRNQCVTIDTANDSVALSPVFSWRANDFITAYDGTSPPAFAARSPIERAVLAFVGPKLLAAENAFLAKNEFKVVFKSFDWSLNDLTGRGGR